MIRILVTSIYLVWYPLLWAMPSVALLAALVAFALSSISRERIVTLQDRVELAADVYAEVTRGLLQDTEACGRLFDRAQRVPVNLRPTVQDVASSCSGFLPSRTWIVVTERRRDGALQDVFNGAVGPGATLPVIAADHPVVAMLEPAMDRARTTGEALLSDVLKDMSGDTFVMSTIWALDGQSDRYLSVRIAPNSLLKEFGLDLTLPGSFTGLISPDGRVLARRPASDTLGDLVPPKLLALLGKTDRVAVRNAPAWRGPVPQFDLVAGRIDDDAGYIVVAGAPSQAFLSLLLQEAELFVIILLSFAALIGTMTIMRQSVLSKVVLESLQAEKTAAIAEGQRQARLMEAIAHEVRSPVVRLIGALELAFYVKDDTRLTIAQGSAQSLLQLVDDLLDVARLDKRQQSEADAGTLVSVADLVAEVAAEFADEARNDGLALTFSTSPPNVCMVLDRVRVQRILSNLVSNAVRCTISGCVKIDAKLRPDADGANSLVLTVTDTGVGIPADLRERVFDEFVSERPDGKTSGTGLGLALVSRLVSNLGGTVTFRDRPGGGTVFDVILPVKDGTVSASVTESVDCLRDLRILIVDDEDVIRLATRRRLENVSAIVTEAGNGAEAVALCRARKFDGVLMDFEMPVLDGLEATRRIRTILGTDAPPIFGLTSHVRALKEREAQNAGMIALFSKPVQLSAIAQQLCGSSIPDVTGHGHTPRDEHPYLDMAVFSDAVGTEPEAAAQIARFEKAAQTLYRALIAAETTETDALANDVHRFKGVAMIFGAVRLTEKLQELELTLTEPESEDQAGDVAAQVAAVPTCLAETIEAMRAAQQV